MRKDRLESILAAHGRTIEDMPNGPEWHLKYFGTEHLEAEVCPECGDEVKVKQDGTSSCPSCGHKHVLPCNNCPLLELDICDWSDTSRCTPFSVSESRT